MEQSVDIVVVGAGIAGLVAARELTRAGLEVLVLEARDRVGGRLLNADLPDGSPIDVGGQWVGPTQHRIHELIRELGLETFPTHTAGRHIAELGGTRSEYTGAIPHIDPRTLADIVRARSRLDRMAAAIPPDEPWRAADAERLDSQTFETWLRRAARTRRGRAYFRSVTEAVFAAGPEDLSALWAGFYIGAAGGLDALIDTAGGAQQDRVVGGAQAIALAVARELGERVVLDSPVIGIEWSDAGAHVRSHRGVVSARHVVIAVPPPLASRISYSPGVPGDRDQLVQRMPMGRVIKINVVYPEPFWRTDGWSGQANSTSRPLGTVFDNTPHEGGPGVLVGFLEGRHADAGARMTAEDRHALVLEDLAGYYGPRARDPLAVIDHDWAGEEYSRGCYGAFATPGTLTRFGENLRRPVGPLHWAGTETATEWAGYMDGAVESGQRVAAEIARPDRQGPVRA
ncbi:flavin monoamine oxidase family protein [Dietzia kunjamensis]|jgi:monoamine oxidase|nr:flavin monoamine oxidase family protein [Dietzia kunjamensis]MDJ0420949.1 flavin monoamine oxidase family protein [Dietzia kunjamensis]